MKFLQLFLLLIFFVAVGTPCYAQRDVNTSSARAAYSMPSSTWYQKSKKKQKTKTAKRSAKRSRKTNTDVAKERRRSLHF